ncbi:WGR domain-containing protein [Methylobacterium sp. AMS5]|uniref:WGR domain-containing protein n=1 Tax=Methylobacterium sp. AMS5 TaxID=925818 RepID=UPI00074FA968|nr:WGR domain-containing protein [Methylobacterium sp. AMS5]AMB48234.1 hypothetical protein Y590_25030 [Methylobacterium sp. AMS5]
MIPVYPIAVRKLTMQHRTHEKDYHQVLICTNEGRSVVINRWGKRGAKGQMEIKRFGTIKEATAALESKNRDKQKGGYVHDRSKDNLVQCNDEAEFKKAVGTLYWFEMKSDLVFLVPNIPTDGMKDPDLPTWEPDGNGGIVHKGYQPKHKYVEPEPTVEEKVAENELWGSW